MTKDRSLLRTGITGRMFLRQREGVAAIFPMIAMVAGVAVTLTWAYWSTIIDLAGEWRENPDYSVGQLVPLVALYLVWTERENLRRCRIQPSWWGLAVIVAACLVRFYGLLFLLQSAERYSLVLMIIGLVLLLAGGDVLRRVKWILLFLFLMVPLPGRIHNTISSPLQNQATAGAVFFLETFGVSVVREGNVLLLNGTTPVAVAEACSGLRMLTAFVVVSATLTYIVRRPRWQKIILLLSSIPVAIVCNLLRLCGTAELFLVASSETAERFFHDFAGLTMMPLAVFILIGELILMNKIAPSEQPAACLSKSSGKVIRVRRRKTETRK